MTEVFLYLQDKRKGRGSDLHTIHIIINLPVTAGDFVLECLNFVFASIIFCSNKKFEYHIIEYS